MSAADKIRVLIVDDVAETRDNVTKLLQFERDFEVVGAARGGREALQMARQMDPDVVIMDINMPDMDGITATEELRRILPYVQIVILSVQGDPSYMRRAMLAGARDFLTKPPAVDELINAVRRAGRLAHEERAKAVQTVATAPTTGGGAVAGNAGRGKVITLYSPKGGLGTTTVAISLAAALQADDTPTVIVDGRLQFGDVALMLNEHGKRSVLDLAPRAQELEEDVVRSVLLEHSETGLHILAAPTRPEEAEQITAEQMGLVVDYLRRLFEYVVVDTDSALNEVTLTLLERSDLILLLVGQDIMSIKDAALMNEVIRMLDLPPERMMLVVSQYERRLPVPPEKVSAHLKLPLAGVIPWDLKAAWTALQRGLPMLRTGGRDVVNGFRQLAKAVRQRMIELVEASEA